MILWQDEVDKGTEQIEDKRTIVTQRKLRGNEGEVDSETKKAANNEGEVKYVRE